MMLKGKYRQVITIKLVHTYFKTMIQDISEPFQYLTFAYAFYRAVFSLAFYIY